MLKISKILTIITLGISYGNTSDISSLDELNDNSFDNNHSNYFFNYSMNNPFLNELDNNSFYDNYNNHFFNYSMNNPSMNELDDNYSNHSLNDSMNGLNDNLFGNNYSLDYSMNNLFLNELDDNYDIFSQNLNINNEFYNNYINDNILDIKEDVDKNISENVDKNISNDKNNIQNIKDSVKNNNMIKYKSRNNQQELTLRWKTMLKNSINTFKEKLTGKGKNKYSTINEQIKNFIKKISNNKNYICINTKLDEMDEFIVQFLDNNTNEIPDILEILKITKGELKTIIKGLLQKFDIIDNNKYSENTTTYGMKHKCIKRYVNSIIRENNSLKNKKNDNLKSKQNNTLKSKQDYVADFLCIMFKFIYVSTPKCKEDLQHRRLQQHRDYEKECNNNIICECRRKNTEKNNFVRNAKVYLYNIYMCTYKIPNLEKKFVKYSAFNEYYEKRMPKKERQAFDDFFKPYSWLFQNKLHEDLIANKLGFKLSPAGEQYFANKYIKMLSTYNNIKIEVYDDDNKINNSVSINTNNLSKKQKQEIDELIKECKKRGFVSLLDPTRNRLNKHIIKLEGSKVIKVEKKILEQFIKRILERKQINRSSKYDNQILDISNSNMLNDNKEEEIQLDKCRRKLNKIIEKDNNNEEAKKNNKKEITVLNQKRAYSKNKSREDSKTNNKNEKKNTRKSKNKPYNKINNNYDNNESLKSKIK